MSEYIEYAEFKLELEYKQIQTLEYHLKKLDGQIIDQDFAEKVRVKIRIPEQNHAALKALFQ